jgi:membrane peptidoglycan carboxypeptidase
VQRAIEDGFDAVGFNGAAVVLDPRDGGVLGFTSRPAYDPNAFAAGIDRATWSSLMTDEDRPLNNRAIQGRYSPGSTFKMAVALAALEEGVITPDFKVHCSGGASFYGHYFKCWRKGGHGAIDLRHAIEQSCDVYFYTIANMVGVDNINKWATLLGPRREERHRSAERGARARAVDRVEAAAHEGKEVVRGRDDLGRHWTGRCRRDPGVDGGLHGDARQRRHARHAPPAQGC